jgi:hypothetical protein
MTTAIAGPADQGRQQEDATMSTNEKVTPLHTADKGAATPNPFANLDALRNPQDYEEFMNGETTAAFAVRTLKEAMHLRVNPDPAYTLLGQYTVLTKDGAYFVYPQFRAALGPLPRRCNLHIAVDGHGVYFLLLVKQANRGDPEDNVWYRTASETAAAATKGWVKVTKPNGTNAGWGYVQIRHAMLEPRWPTKSFDELLCAAFPDRVVTSLNHDLIQNFEKLGS